MTTDPPAAQAAPIAETRLSVRGLRITTARLGREVEIVLGVGLEVGAGETVAIVGESGSGKSLTARSLIGLLPPGVEASGEILYEGRDLMPLSARQRRRLRGSAIALSMQDPFTLLNPLERCGEQIVAALEDSRGRRLNREERRREAQRRLAEVRIDDPAVVDRFPHELSGGMRQRVGIAAAIAESPRLLIADEPTTALDVTTQAEILDLLKSLSRSHAMGLILITHDLRVAFSVCERVYVMYAGSLVEHAAAAELETSPRHPYSLGLLLADPPVDRRVAELVGIPGSVPTPGDRPSGCPFHPRCRWAQEVCKGRLPSLETVGDGHLTRCVRIDEIAGELQEIRDEQLAGASREPAARDAAGGEPLVAMRDVRKEFIARGRRGRQVVALGGVSIDVRAGESVGLVGESGSGKTTLGRTLVGLERATSGEVVVAGVDFHARSLPKAARNAVRETVQMVFQDPYSSLNPARTVRATLREAVELGGSDGDPERAIGELLERVGLPANYSRRRPSELSGGERQRVAIARALARRPRLIVCDEVASALDVSVQAQILNLLRSLQRELGLAYLFITHDLAVVRQVTHRLYVLRRGEVVEEGPTETVLAYPRHPYTQQLIASIPGTAEETRGSRSRTSSKYGPRLAR